MSSVAIALIAIVALQILWLFTVYQAYYKSINLLITNNLKQSIEEEFLLRNKQIGGTVSFSIGSKEDDNSMIRTGSVVAADTIYKFSYNSANKYNDAKARQTALKYFLPLNINDLDSIFNQLLLNTSVPVKYTVIEMFDKDKNETKRTHLIVKSRLLQNFETETFWLDLTDTIGIKAFVQIPYDDILRQLALQLFLSALLITGVTIVLFRLSQTIFRQYKAESIKKEYINFMTHEFNRPIASSLLSLEFLQDHIHKNDRQSNEELLDNSILALKKLSIYVEKIQEISLGADEKIELVKDNISLISFFRDFKERYEAVKHKKVTIHLQIAEEINLTTDLIHFSNIMDNLTENSIKYSDESVKIDIKVFRQDSNVHIHHRDDGWGIPSSEINNIFDNFYRGRSVEKRRKKGFGLGLSYVKTMMKQLGGSISVSSKVKEFTEFIIIHPL